MALRLSLPCTRAGARAVCVLRGVAGAARGAREARGQSSVTSRPLELLSRVAARRDQRGVQAGLHPVPYLTEFALRTQPIRMSGVHLSRYCRAAPCVAVTGERSPKEPPCLCAWCGRGARRWHLSRCPVCCCDGRAISEGAALCMCVVLARGAHLSRHQPPVETLRVYPKNVHQPWPLALKSTMPLQ